MDKSSAIRIAKEYAKLVLKNMALIEIILYGSYAKGTAKKDSDIDIAIIVSRLIGDYLDSATMLYRLRRQIDNRIEPVLLEEGSEKSGFLEDIRKTGYRIYPEV